MAKPKPQPAKKPKPPKQPKSKGANESKLLRLFGLGR